MAVVDIVIPTYKGIHSEANSNLHLMIRDAACFCGTHEPWKCPKGKHSIKLLPHQKSTVVHWARNQAMAMALYGQEDPSGRPPADYFFLMDDDMLCQPGHLRRLLSYKLDAVTGIATVRRDPPRPNIRLWNPEKKFFFQPVEWDWDSNKLIEIDAVGAAYFLVKRRVFERMAIAYLKCEFERLEDKRKFPRCDEIDAFWDMKSELRVDRWNAAVEPGGDWKQADGHWFEYLSNIVDSQLDELGEDIGFCWKVKKLGFKIYADPQVLPGHLGDYGYSLSDYRDWLECEKQLGRVPTMEPPNDPKLTRAPELHGVDDPANN